MRRFFAMPPQVLRILLLALGIVSSYAIARHLLTPPSFNEYGFYRGAALGELADRPVVHAGRQECEVCHDEVAPVLAKGSHRRLSCEGCHGTAQAHADKPDLAQFKPVKLTYSHCVRCHEASPARPKAHKQVVTRDHYPGDKCTECHKPHHPAETP